MVKRLFANTPKGATHLTARGQFLKKYSGGWLVWNSYHATWIHLDYPAEISCEVGEPE